MLNEERLKTIRDYDTCVTLEESAEMARAMLASINQRPVAWRVGGFVSSDFKWVERRSEEDNLLIEPLYLHPIITGIDEDHYNPELEPGLYVAEIVTKGGAAIINGRFK